MKKLIKNNSEFEFIVTLINESRNRAYQKVNEELVLLYFKVGKIVSEKVTEGSWGDGTVNELAAFIEKKIPELSSFNRRGLYRMKQFYEIYSKSSECFTLWLQTKFPKVSPMATPSPETENELNEIVSPVATQFQNIENLHDYFILAESYNFISDNLYPDKEYINND
ncbi:MAG: hypothetical protein IPL48_04810 [Bacteroidetes bacterium]|nr:hypothetical protein [Bacteroidota bacterium]